MFEQKLEDTTTTYWVDSKDSALLDSCGEFALLPKWNHLTYVQAVDLISHAKRTRPGVSSYILKRFDNIFTGIRVAFGPEFMELHNFK